MLLLCDLFSLYIYIILEITIVHGYYNTRTKFIIVIFLLHMYMGNKYIYIINIFSAI